jgi:DMSO/TMAO reductase YedYZ molybdopterin-dependent catalytic subunit
MWMHHISRRRMLQLAASTALIATVRPQSLLNQPWAEEGQARDAGKLASQDLLRTRVSRPYDAETHVSAFNEWITPNKSFFVRSHFGPPPTESVDPALWRLTVAGLVDRSLTLSLADLKQFAEVTITAVLQCSGNGRAFHQPRAPGVQWERGAMGNAQWTGVRLTDVLQRAGVRRARARHVQLEGADRPVSDETPRFIRSIPLAKALHPDTLLVYRMNGEPLPLLHGGPLRLIAPGWMADACTKWLTTVTIQEQEAEGYYMQTAYRYPIQPVEPGAAVPREQLHPVEAMVVKSLIVSPSEGASLANGPVLVQGVAWTGEGRVTLVEVSTDGGVSWHQARLLGEDLPYAWRRWDYRWEPKSGGTGTILSRATDSLGHVQPERSPWNPGGFLWNGWDRVTVTITS